MGADAASGVWLPASGESSAPFACGWAASGSLGFGFWLGNGVGLDGPALGEVGEMPSGAVARARRRRGRSVSEWA